jgi:hypothetical protein
MEPSGYRHDICPRWWIIHARRRPHNYAPAFGDLRVSQYVYELKSSGSNRRSTSSSVARFLLHT